MLVRYILLSSSKTIEYSLQVVPMEKRIQQYNVLFYRYHYLLLLKITVSHYTIAQKVTKIHIYFDLGIWHSNYNTRIRNLYFAQNS